MAQIAVAHATFSKLNSKEYLDVDIVRQQKNADNCFHPNNDDV